MRIPPTYASCIAGVTGMNLAEKIIFALGHIFGNLNQHVKEGWAEYAL
jgi:hypothetical protein